MELNKKKIVLFTDWFTPAYKAGGPVQSCQNIVNLLQDKYDFYVITSDRDLGDTQAYPHLVLNSWIQSTPRIRIFYASPGYLNKEVLRKLIKEINPDTLYFNSLFSVPYTLKPLAALGKKYFSGKIVLAPRGMLHEGALRRKYFKKKLFLRLINFFKWPASICFHATDAQEIVDIKKHLPGVKQIIQAENIPNIFNDSPVGIEKHPGEVKLVFISRIHPKKNLHYFLKLLKQCSAGKILFNIYGHSTEKAYENECKKLAQQLPESIKVNFMGPIPNDQIFAVVQAHHFFVLPTLGENFGHAIFESFSAGRPVIISNKTPWQDLDQKSAGWSLPLSNEAAYLSALKQSVEMDQEAFNQLCLGARTYSDDFLKNCSYHALYAGLFE